MHDGEGLMGLMATKRKNGRHQHPLQCTMEKD